MKILSETATTQQKAAYAAYVKVLMKKVENITKNEFIPAICGGHRFSEDERNLLALPVKLGSLGLK